jgi:hypothetical protein
MAMNVQDNVVDESVPVAARHADESDQILELSSAASVPHHSPTTSEASSTYDGSPKTRKPLKSTGDDSSPPEKEDDEMEHQEQEQPEDDEKNPSTETSSSKPGSPSSAHAKRPVKKKGHWKKPLVSFS